MDDVEEDFDNFEAEKGALSPTSKSRLEIDKILNYAKLDKDDLLPNCQRFYFADELDNGEIKLMEVEPELAEMIKNGEPLIIRGEANDNVVICTSNKTYDLKEAQTSNSLLISSNMQFCDQIHPDNTDIVDKEVCSVLHSYYELKPCRPRLKKLQTLLNGNPYCGRVEEAANDKRKYTYSDLLDIIQASECELKDALNKLQAFDLHGFIRVIDFELLSKVLQDVEGLIYEKGWTVDEIPLNECCTALKELYDSDVISHVVKCYADKNEASETEDLYKLNEEKVAKFYASMLLRDTGKFHLRDFTDTWRQSLPEGLSTDLAYLQGLAIIDRSNKPEVVWYFSVDNLPEDINERFNALFKSKEKWTLEEITPYVEEFATEKSTVNALLTKHCRASTSGGVRVYSSRRPIY